MQEVASNNRIAKPKLALPYLPFSMEEEYKLFAACALRNVFPMENTEDASIAWCKLFDGIKVFPKLPVHIRIHKEAFERNQRVRNCVERAEYGQKLLDKLNKATKPKLSANAEAVKCAKAMPAI